MKKIIYIIISTILISCSTSESIELKSNKTISETFNESEIKDLQIIFDFFNGQICDSKKMDYDSLNECYEKYCSEIRKQQKLGNEFNIKVNFEQQIEMYKKVNKSTFNQIWGLSKSWNYKTSDTLKYLGLNTIGKYNVFLKKYGEENKPIFDYYENFNATGDISPSMNASLIMQYELYDISDLRTKLIIAIHYLTLNDQNTRNEKY